MVKHTQFVGKLPMNCFSVFDHFVKLVLKSLRFISSFVVDNAKFQYDQFTKKKNGQQERPISFV